jgi:hypothetical protein
VSFIRTHVVALRLDLWRRCASVVCGADETCGDAGCRAIAVGPEELPEWSGSLPGAVDASTPDDAWSLDAREDDDGGVDAAIDPPDAPLELPDAGPIDAAGDECASATDCDDGWTCTTDECVSGRCAHTPHDSACDDGVACTSQRCDEARGCLYTTRDSACDDGVACTTDLCDRLAGCRSTPVHTTCASGSYCDVTAGCTVGPRFADLYTSIIQSRCAPCHVTMTPRGGDLDMSTETAARAALVGVTATCGSGVNTRVIAGDSAHSLLYRKVAGVDLCGARMPRLLMPLDDAQIAAIAHWIDSGAR